MPRFADATAEAGLAGFRTFAGDRSSQIPEDMGPGAAWGDFDNDGDEDLFLVSAGGGLHLPAAERAPSELYENRGDGTFQKVADFPDTRILGMAAAWGDYNADGRLDLIVTGYNGLLLFRNDDGELVRDESFPDREGYWAGAAWGDYDNDRDLDLYVNGYVRYVEDTEGGRGGSRQYGATVPYTLNPSSFEPAPNLLFRNDGDGTFTEVAEALGVDNPKGRSLAVLWHDFDDDGWLDLYVGNDVSDNVFYRNRGGTFEEAALASWVADYRGAMGLAAGDWNRDGDDDLFITHWIAQENALYDSVLSDLPGLTAALSGSEAAAPSGPGSVGLRFTDQAALVGLGQIALRFIGWGTEFADFDGDGWLDLVVANGSTFETEEEPRRLKTHEAFLFWNRRGERFHDLAPLNELLSKPHAGRGLAVSDYDLDGDLDVVVAYHGEGVELLRNEMQTGNWIELRLRSRIGETGEAKGFGHGAKVVARLGDTELRRTVSSASYLSQSSLTVHFGLGEAERVDGLEVRWLAGEAQSYAGLEANAVWELTEGDPVARRLSVAEKLSDKERIIAFWDKHRAAMRAMKRDGDIPLATQLFREALALDPVHEDAHYYLGNCLANQGQVEEALAEFRQLGEINPQSHRAFRQWGTLRAVAARSAADLEAAEEALEKALAINKEETGALLVLGELALMRGDEELAEQRLEWACRTNPRAVGGFFLRAYLAWKRGDRDQVRKLLRDAAQARGEEWKPEGTVAEGDVARRMHREETPLARFWKGWDGGVDAASTFDSLDSFLRKPRFEGPDI
ncbi:MAG: tetratricopeptide repeat protein [bacterium]|nr:tetratricopeptide repeat protein [bacterium]